MKSPDEVPELVGRALHNSLVSGWLNSTRTETGRLLAALAASRAGTVAEAGTGSGTGVAWLRSGAPDGCRVVSVERDAARAERAREALAGSDVEVLDGGCDRLHSRAPFALLYMSGEAALRVGRDMAHDLVAPGGIVVVDDFVPSHDWPPRDANGQVDQLRHGWLTDDRFVATEVLVACDLGVVVATRR